MAFKVASRVRRLSDETFRKAFGSEEQSRAALIRRTQGGWIERYNTTPVLTETFVETPRYTGAVYRASGWTYVGTTQGRGRYDRDKLYDRPRKDVWLRPLKREWKRTLNR